MYSSESFTTRNAGNDASPCSTIIPKDQFGFARGDISPSRKPEIPSRVVSLAVALADSPSLASSKVCLATPLGCFKYNFADTLPICNRCSAVPSPLKPIGSPPFDVSYGG